MPNKTTDSIDTLHARRDQLNSQLTDLQSQHSGITQDLQTVDQDWLSALRAGEDTALLGDRRRHRTTELDETNRAITQVTAWISEIDSELARRVPHQRLDADLAQLAVDLRAYDEDRAQLDGAHQAAIDKVIATAQELHELVWTSRNRHDELDVRARNLRSTAAQLDRPDVTVPAPGSWSRPVEQALHGTGAPWRVYLTSVQTRDTQPLARELGNAAGVALAERSRAETAADRAARHSVIR